MPIYTKRCTHCGRSAEVISAIADRDRAEPCEVLIAETGDGDLRCAGELVRDGIELSALMRWQWNLWWRGFQPGQKFG